MSGPGESVHVSRARLERGPRDATAETAQICRRAVDGAVSPRVAGKRLRAHSGRYLRTLWYAHRDVYEISRPIPSPRGALGAAAHRDLDDRG
jgi:hypothetical protein